MQTKTIQSVKSVDRDKMAKWRKDLNPETIAKIANLKPLSIQETREYLLACNKIASSKIEKYEKENGKLEEPTLKSYDVALKQCVDARAVSTDLKFHLAYKTIHERTAGAIVRSGHVFKQLNEKGIGIEEVHYKCGAEDVAHTYHKGLFTGTPDSQLIRIVESIPRSVAAIADPIMRTKVNGLQQAIFAAIKMRFSHDMKNPILPAMLRWDNDVVRTAWLATEETELLKSLSLSMHLPEPPKELRDLRRNAVKTQFAYAYAEGRQMDKQYAHTVFMYDAFRLGRFNDPRVIFNLLPNEAFCVTFDFRKLERDKPISIPGLGSVKYAAFHDGGHVAGVGGKEGTRHVAIIDTSEKMLFAAKKSLLGYNHIAEATDGGRTVTLMLYDKKTREVQIIAD